MPGFGSNKFGKPMWGEKGGNVIVQAIVSALKATGVFEFLRVAADVVISRCGGDIFINRGK